MQTRLVDVRAQVQIALEQAMAGLPEGDLADAMRYACIGGKRIRAFLVMESARLCGLTDRESLPVATAVEALHAYSLVHDDLPAMDDDDLRRGLPTVHVQWSEATAILAGDALQSLAFGLLTDPKVGAPDARLALIRGFSDAIGARGMVWGQALDIAAETAVEPLDIVAVKRMQSAKTGALIQFSATAGAIMANEDAAALAEYARNLGLAFQIQDDILDVIGNEEEIGKRTHKDDAANKATFVSLLGLEGAQDKARKLARSAEAALEPYGEAAENLRELARFVIERDA
ncbi:polyprenyl synthetase family protein [Paracoccus sp. (in: a-proteobacteria)]|uniref:polyprenyl synthetase family protein n=1 Tax=Paracoccus sp. TaxID=267 RepID=UPI003220950E